MERRKYLTTGELARLTHVTKNTLFHYDKIGLFSPELVAENEYRYYSVHQVEVLNTIIMLRNLGMPLKEIRLFLEGRNPEKLIELFEKEEAQIQEQIAYLKKQSQWIKEKSEKVKNVLAVDTEQIYTRHQPETFYVINELDDLSDAAYAEKITELTELYAKKNSSTCYEIGNIQHSSDIMQGIYDNYQNVAIVTKQKPKSMKYYSMPEGEYLVAYSKGDWTNSRLAYEKLLRYAREKGLKLSAHFLEIYVVDSLTAEKQEDYITEISVRMMDEKNF